MIPPLPGLIAVLVCLGALAVLLVLDWADGVRKEIARRRHLAELTGRRDDPYEG